MFTAITLNVLILSITKNFDKLGEALGTSINTLNNVEPMATTTTPAVTNGGSSSSGGGDTIKSVQRVMVTCKYGSSSYSVAINTINTAKTRVFIPAENSATYNLESNKITFYKTTDNNLGYHQNFCGKSNVAYDGAYSEPNQMTVEIVEYN